MALSTLHIALMMLVIVSGTSGASVGSKSGSSQVSETKSAPIKSAIKSTTKSSGPIKLTPSALKSQARTIQGDAKLDASIQAPVQPQQHQRSCCCSCCCCGHHQSGGYARGGLSGYDPQFESNMRDIVRFAIAKFRSPQGYSTGFQLGAMPPISSQFQSAPIGGQIKAASTPKSASDSSSDPFGLSFNNGLLDMGLTTDGFKFGLDSDTFKDAMDAASGIVGRAGIQLGHV